MFDWNVLQAHEPLVKRKIQFKQKTSGKCAIQPAMVFGASHPGKRRESQLRFGNDNELYDIFHRPHRICILHTIT